MGCNDSRCRDLNKVDTLRWSTVEVEACQMGITKGLEGRHLVLLAKCNHSRNHNICLNKFDKIAGRIPHQIE